MALGARTRFPVLLALALPVLSGLGYLHFAGAPSRYLAINGGALVLGLTAAFFVSQPAGVQKRRALAILLLAGLFVPLISGPAIDGVARWIPIGPFTLHTAGLLLPALLVLALGDREYGPPLLLAAVLAGLLQPDAAIGFVIFFACAGHHDVTRDWRIGLVCILAFIAALIMATRGNPAPQQFVERLLVEAAGVSLALAAGLFLSLLASFFLVLRIIPAPKATRYALAGSLFGFTVLSIMANYPGVLIGYGAAPILGFGLALGLSCKSSPEPRSVHGD